MTTGTSVVCTIQVRQDRKPLVFKGTVLRVDAPTPTEKDGTGGWPEGIVAHYPKVKYRGEPCVIFHQWPSLYVKEA